MNQNMQDNEKSTRLLFASARHENVECAMHVHATMEIVLVTEGCLEMTVADRKYEIEEGQGVFIPPFVRHCFSSPSHNRCHVLMFSKELVRYFFEFSKGNLPTSHLFSVSPAGMRLAEELLPDADNTADYIRAEAVLAPLCYDVWQGCAFVEGKQAQDDTLTGIMEYMDRHFCEELTLESVARAMGVHPVTVSKLFVKQVGVGFHDHLQYLRCDHAARMIKTGDESFSQVAYESGFGSIRSFNRAFRALYGVTPTEYKAKGLA